MNHQFRQGTRYRPRKQPNAQKHGMFSLVAILPGEDPRLFAALHSAVVKEWAPDGPTEDDAVLSIAKGLWRKARLQKFLEGKVTACRLDGSHPAFDRVNALRGVCGVLEVAPEYLDELLNRLPEDLKERLKGQFPPRDFESNSARAQAVRNEINSVILPELQRFDKPLAVSFLEASDILTQDDFKHEIAVEERIDAMIDRAVKRLMQTKAMKQILATSKINNEVVGSTENIAPSRVILG